MNLATLPYLLPYLISLAISTSIAIYAWNHRWIAGGLYFAVMVMGQAGWILGYILELASPEIGTKLFWDNFQVIPGLLIPASMLLFILDYVRHPLRDSRWLLGLLFTVQVIFMVLIFTSDWHSLMRSEVRLIDNPPFDTLYYDLHPGYGIFALYLYGLILVGFWHLGKLFRHAQPFYRRQITILVVGFLVPIIGSMGIFFADITIAGQRDLTPFTFAISNIIITWGLFRFQLLDVVPVARDTVIENMADAVIVIDRENRIVDLNPAAAAGIEQPHTSAIGQPIEVVFSRWQSLLEKYRSTLSARDQIALETAGNLRHLEINISPLYDKRQQLIGRLVIVRDITQQVKAQEELRQRSLELEAANQELQIAWDAARAADRVKSQFLASMSHELRTPLNAILNFTEFMLVEMLGPVNERQKDALDKILGSGRHLLSLINDVLDITKIEAGMMRLFVEDEVDLHQELSSVIATAETLVKNKRVKFVTDIDNDLPIMVGDKRRIRQILLNLISNAAKFTEQGTITLSVKRRETDILFMVSDTGPGITLQDQEMIFEPFRQSDSGFKSGSGTGLGLPISRRLAEAHGGRLWLESEPGDGATFFVALPIRSETLLAMMEPVAEKV
jgi:PAS domain S-box-containing protein